MFLCRNYCVLWWVSFGFVSKLSISIQYCLTRSRWCWSMMTRCDVTSGRGWPRTSSWTAAESRPLVYLIRQGQGLAHRVLSPTPAVLCPRLSTLAWNEAARHVLALVLGFRNSGKSYVAVSWNQISCWFLETKLINDPTTYSNRKQLRGFYCT